MKNLIKIITGRFSWLLMIAGYVLVNIIFNYRVYWHQLVTDLSKSGAVWGEVQSYEWLTDKFYQTIMSGQNPFGLVQGILYPFNFHLGLTDAANGFYFLFLRPFFSAHQSMSIIVALSLLFANIGMYLLLRTLKFDKLIAFFIGLSYGYMTFLFPRGGHLNYWCIYLFPWFYYCLANLLQSDKKFVRILSSFGASLFFVLTLWLNFYYFVMLLISLFCLFLYYLSFKRQLFYEQIKKLWPYGILTFLLTAIFLVPWATGLYEAITFDEIPKTSGWGGAIEFASDLFNYFIPSGYGYYVSKFPFLYKPFLLFLKLFRSEARSIFENFTYPGVIILFSYFVLIFFLKKFDKKTKENIKPFLFTSIVFFILTLGPFLHVFGHWTLTVDEGIKIVIPLPYIILHYIPFLNNIRVPGRLIVGFIFFAYVVCAYLINYFLKNKSIHFKQIFFAIFLLVFIFDQRVADNIFPPPQVYPYKIFQTIKSDKEKVSVLEIPFTVRDGFTYFGNGDAIGMTIGESWHGKPAIGGYMGRVSDYKKNYYRLNPFFGYLGRLIDDSLYNNPIIDKDDLINWTDLDINKSRETIDFLSLKYIILNNEMLYAATLSAKLKELGFEKQMADKKFSLLKRISENKDFLSIDLGSENDINYLGMGWHNQEGNFRWSDKKNFVMFKTTKQKKYDLHFKAAAFNKDQLVTIYLNKKKISKVNISTAVKEYSVPINIKFETGINKVYFIFDGYFRPIDVIPGSLDERKISTKFLEIYLTEIK
ncbi:MAG: hypothetical protein AAB437_00125 [Patescibacteria group bacterium]